MFHKAIGSRLATTENVSRIAHQLWDCRPSGIHSTLNMSDSDSDASSSSGELDHKHVVAPKKVPKKLDDTDHEKKDKKGKKDDKKKKKREEKKDRKKKEKKEEKKRLKKEKKKAEKDAKKKKKNGNDEDSDASEVSLDHADLLKEEKKAAKKKKKKREKETKNGSSYNSSSNLYDSDSFNASKSRFAVIDPTSSAMPKLDRPPLPQLDDTPDWLFQPSEEKLNSVSALGISRRMAEERQAVKKSSIEVKAPRPVSEESKKYAADMRKKLQGAKPASERLFDALNHDPWDRNNGFKDEDAKAIIKKHPETCKEQYRFEATKDKMYPLSMLCALGASASTLKACYKAYPPAMEFDDGWIGTPMHYACTYRAPREVLKFLIDKDDSEDMIEKVNLKKRLPLHLAAMIKTPVENIMLLIKEYHKGLAAVDCGGMTPLHLACNRSDPDPAIIELLTSKYVKACLMTDNKGATPLHLAVARGVPMSVLEILLTAEDQAIQVQDMAGNLPLHQALQVNAPKDIIQFLSWQFADGLEIANEKNERPVDMARRIRKRDKDLHEILDPG